MGDSAAVVQGDHLAHEGQEVLVGTPEWFQWLAEVQSFRYQAADTAFSARKERAASGRGDWYWKAYSRINGVLRRTYLGKTEDLTLAKLQEAARTLAPESEPPAATPSPREASPLTGLLRTKLMPPPQSGALVIRPRLTQRLYDGLRRKVTLISAPAGFGKTTLISEWRADPGREVPLAWLSLEEADNDPTQFWLYLIAALQVAAPGVGLEAAAWLRSPNSPIPAVLTALLNELALAPADLVLVLDDYHLIDAREIQDQITFFVEHLPPQVHLFMTTRVDPDLPLARLRARGHLLEVRAEDLRFTAEEAAAFLKAMGLALSGEALAALEARTEGWAAGLQLAALSLQGRDDVEGFLRRFADSDRYVFDYLISEVLEQQPAHIRQFLMETAILDRLHGDLCAALTGRRDSALMLEELVQANLFIVALDVTEGWYRYHHLFGTVLRHRLRREQPEALPVLHRRAADWFRAQRLTDEAVEQALAAETYDMAAELLVPVVQQMLYTGRRSTFNRWLDRIPPHALERWPVLQMHRWWLFVFSGQLEDAPNLAEAGQRALRIALPPEMQREVAQYQAYWQLFQGNGLEAATAAEAVLRLSPPGPSPLVAPAMVLRSGGYILAGDFQRGEPLLTEALALCHGPAMLFPRCLALNLTGNMRIAQGRLHEAAKALHAVFREAGDRPIFQRAEAGFYLAAIHLEWNDLDRAEQYVRDGLHLADQTRQQVYTSLGHLNLARVLVARGDYQAAQSAFDEALHQYQRRSHQDGIRAVCAYRVRAELALGNLQAAQRWAEGVQFAETEAIPYQHEVEAFTLARVLLAQRQCARALTVLTSMLKTAVETGRTPAILEAEILLALTHEALGDRRQAVATLTRALSRAEPGGYTRLFLDEGSAMVDLLLLLPPGAGAGRILGTAGDGAQAAGAKLPEPLTEREREVLELVAEGLSNRELSAALHVTEETVKTHLKHLFGKVGVGSRVKLITRARELRLLP